MAWVPDSIGGPTNPSGFLGAVEGLVGSALTGAIGYATVRDIISRPSSYVNVDGVDRVRQADNEGASTPVSGVSTELLTVGFIGVLAIGAIVALKD
jgi:hypothetical protein